MPAVLSSLDKSNDFESLFSIISKLRNSRIDVSSYKVAHMCQDFSLPTAAMNKSLGFIIKNTEECLMPAKLTPKERSKSTAWNREFSNLETLNSFLERNKMPSFKDTKGSRWMYHRDNLNYVLHYSSMELVATPSSNHRRNWKICPFYLQTRCKITVNAKDLVERKIEVEQKVWT